jgi:hypothetical protein
VCQRLVLERVFAAEHCDLESTCDALLILQYSLTLIASVAIVEGQKEKVGKACEDLLHEREGGELKDSTCNLPFTNLQAQPRLCTHSAGWQKD